MVRDIHEAGFEEFNIRSQEAARLTTRAVQKPLSPVDFYDRINLPADLFFFLHRSI
jgi:hypothetical protein